MKRDSVETDSITAIGSVIYGGFWKRLLALIIDFLFLLPFGFLNYNLLRPIQAVYAWGQFSLLAISIAFNVLLVWKIESTPGMYIMGLKIAQSNCARITLSTSLKRYSVNIALGLIMAYANFIAINAMPSELYQSATFITIAQLTIIFYPGWANMITNISLTWVASEFVVLLMNKQKRAIHDLIAGSIVVVSAKPFSRDPFKDFLG